MVSAQQLTERLVFLFGYAGAKRYCRECGGEFATVRVNQAFCSELHRRRQWSRTWNRENRSTPPTDRQCPCCRRMFQSAHRSKRYCSMQCKRELYKTYRRQKDKWRKCKQCATGFSAGGKTATRTFCSGLCRNRWWRAHKGEKAAVTLACPTCQDQFTTHHQGHKYCSEPCRVAARSKRDWAQVARRLSNVSGGQADRAKFAPKPKETA